MSYLHSFFCCCCHCIFVTVERQCCNKSKYCQKWCFVGNVAANAITTGRVSFGELNKSLMSLFIILRFYHLLLTFTLITSGIVLLIMKKKPHFLNVKHFLFHFHFPLHPSLSFSIKASSHPSTLPHFSISSLVPAFSAFPLSSLLSLPISYNHLIKSPAGPQWERRC